MQPNSFLAKYKKEIEALCRKYAVKRLRLFGSALSDSWNPEASDIDFLAEFDPPVDMNAFDQYMGLVLDLEALFGRKVDVVDWNAAKNPFFKRNAERSAVELYASVTVTAAFGGVANCAKAIAPSESTKSRSAIS